MPDTQADATRRSLSPDIFAVGLALLAALLVRLNLLPAIKW
jgi:hypothetical protein